MAKAEMKGGKVQITVDSSVEDIADHVLKTLRASCNMNFARAVTPEMAEEISRTAARLALMMAAAHGSDKIEVDLTPKD